MKNLLSLFGLLLFLACKKDAATEKDREVPVITLFSPVEGHTYTSGQNIKIAGTITDNNFIAEVHIVLTNNSTGGDILHAHMYAQGDSTSFEHDIPATAGVDYKVVITAVDRNVNQAYSRVLFSCN